MECRQRLWSRSCPSPAPAASGSPQWHLRPADELSFDTVRAELAFRGRVVAAYEAIQAEGLSFPADKAAVMRLLATRFTKNEMRRVYAALVAAIE